MAPNGDNSPASCFWHNLQSDRSPPIPFAISALFLTAAIYLSDLSDSPTVLPIAGSISPLKPNNLTHESGISPTVAAFRSGTNLLLPFK